MSTINIRKIEETLYLLNIPEYADDIKNIRKTENWEDAEIFDANEEW